MRTHDTRLFLAVIILVLIGIVGTSFDGSLTGMQTYAGPTMTETTTLDNAIQFLRAFGFFNVILPFLLIFTIVFGVLEKTKIFGTEKFKGDTVPRRNLNSVVSFCIAFFVVAASNVVGLLQVSLPIIALVLVIIIVFLLLFGSMMSNKELEEGISLWKFRGFKNTFVLFIVIAVLAILLAGFGLLDDVLFFVGSNLTGTFITSLVLLIILVGAVWFVVGSHGKEEAK